MYICHCFSFLFCRKDSILFYKAHFCCTEHYREEINSPHGSTHDNVSLLHWCKENVRWEYTMCYLSERE